MAACESQTSNITWKLTWHQAHATRVLQTRFGKTIKYHTMSSVDRRPCGASVAVRTIDLFNTDSIILVFQKIIGSRNYWAVQKQAKMMRSIQHETIIIWMNGLNNSWRHKLVDYAKASRKDRIVPFGPREHLSEWSQQSVATHKLIHCVRIKPNWHERFCLFTWCPAGGSQPLLPNSYNKTDAFV